MLREFRSREVAHRAFQRYARLEPKLNALWEVCRLAAPPKREPVDGDDDPFFEDAFDVDPVALGSLDDGWCAEVYFFREVKPPMLVLVGWHRPSGPAELTDSVAYDTVYSALFFHALVRSCSCCRFSGDGRKRLRA